VEPRRNWIPPTESDGTLPAQKRQVPEMSPAAFHFTALWPVITWLVGMSQCWNRVFGSPGRWVNDFGRVGLGHGSAWQTRCLTRFLWLRKRSWFSCVTLQKTLQDCSSLKLTFYIYCSILNKFVVMLEIFLICTCAA